MTESDQDPDHMKGKDLAQGLEKEGKTFWYSVCHFLSLKIYFKDMLYLDIILSICRNSIMKKN